MRVRAVRKDFSGGGGDVRVHFWGVRGSVPTPVTPRQVQSKIAAVVQRISAKDVRNQRSKEQIGRAHV